jgi:chromosome segregation ATPase
MLSQMDYEKRLITENNRGRVDQLEKLIESLKQELQVSEAKLGEASRIIQNQQQEIGNFVNHHTDSRAVENALRAEMERLQNIIAAKEAEYKHQLTIFSNENIQLVQVADQLSARVRALEGSLESVHHAMKTAEAENNNLRQTIGNLTAHIETINSSHQQSEKVTQALNHSAKHYEEKIAQLRTDYEQHIQKLANSSSEAHKMIDQLNLRLKQKEGEVGQLKY